MSPGPPTKPNPDRVLENMARPATAKPICRPATKKSRLERVRRMAQMPMPMHTRR